jgi:hypothetical protein
VEAPALVVDKTVVAVGKAGALVAEDLMVEAVAGEDMVVEAADVIDQRFLNGSGSS